MHLFSKENIWSNPILHTSTIILWTELFPKKRREKIQGENFNLHSRSNPRVFPVILHELQCFYMQSSNSNPSTVSPHVIQPSRAILHTELILPQEIPQLQGSSHVRHLPVTAPRVSKHSTRQNPAIRPYSTPSAPDPYRQASSNSTRQKQHSSGSQHPHSPYKIPQAHSYRILPGEIGFISKGSSIVYLCNTKVGVFQITY